MASVFSADQRAQFERDGYIIVPGLFGPREIATLGEATRRDKAMDEAATSRDDGQGHPVRLSLWNHPGDGIYGRIARCRRVVDSVEDLLADEVYHYHSKMILKDAHTGGAWAWHQDYGYWYENGVLYPDLVSVMIAVDPATRANGCLQVLRGSHKLGRVDHGLTGEQAGADPERVAEAEKRLETVHVELDPGDALFFHANLLHCSAANTTENSRWVMICCYNARHNDPYKESHHPRYTPLQKVDDGQVPTSLEEADTTVAYANLDTEDNSARGLADKR